MKVDSHQDGVAAEMRGEWEPAEDLLALHNHPPTLAYHGLSESLVTAGCGVSCYSIKLHTYASYTLPPVHQPTPNLSTVEDSLC